MLRSLLLALDGIVPGDGALATAAELARAGAAVELALTLDEEAVHSPEATGLGGVSIFEHRQSVIEKRLRAGLSRLEDEARVALGPVAERVTVRPVEGDASHELHRLSLEHDLLVLSSALRRQGDSDDIDTDFALSVMKLAAGSPCPLLIADATPLRPGPAVVAYDGARASGRALHAAVLLGLLEGRVVHIVTCGEDAAGIAAHAGALLARHGIAMQPHAEASDDDIAGTILARIADVDAALLVMGSFGERVLHDWLFGSTTETLLASAEPPIFLHC